MSGAAYYSYNHFIMTAWRAGSRAEQKSIRKMKTRTAGETKTGLTTAEFETAMAIYGDAEQREAQIHKDIECEVSELLEKYADELAALGQSKAAAFEMAQAYCMENKQALFFKRRSIGTLSGIAGFRLGNPRLKTLKGSNWNNVLEAIKEKLPGYVRVTEEPAKDMLLADRHKENVAPLLLEIGVQVVQDELFYIEAKKAA